MKSRRAKPLEKLAEAEPVFVEAGGEGITRNGQPVPRRTGVGVLFLCPIHEDCWVHVPFANPIDGGPPLEYRVTWQRTGDTFETLTLSPSIRVLGGPTGCEWHGHIVNGQLLTHGDSA